MARRTLGEKNPGTYVAWLASTFFVYLEYFVVQILLEIGLRAMAAPGYRMPPMSSKKDLFPLNSPNTAHVFAQLRLTAYRNKILFRQTRRKSVHVSI